MCQPLSSLKSIPRVNDEPGEIVEWSETRLAEMCGLEVTLESPHPTKSSIEAKAHRDMTAESLSQGVLLSMPSRLHRKVLFKKLGESESDGL